MYANVNDIMGALPPEYPEALLPSIRREFLETNKSIVVLDDDPTGTQTCYDVLVLTSWSVALLAEELRKSPSILFILTNSRSMPGPAAVALANEIGRNLKQATKTAQRDIVVISRSDSTLRGHFPAEVDAIGRALDIAGAVTLIIPAFIEGGRFTIDDVHYIREGDKLVPVSETPFARDSAFGYSQSNLRKWVEEKTKGAVKASDTSSVSIDDLRQKGPQAVAEKLRSCRPGQICIVNAASFRDLEVFAMGVVRAEKAGKQFLYRTSATFVPIRAGLPSGKLFVPENISRVSTRGSLVVVGSYVPKSTRQLSYLLERDDHHSIEINVREILSDGDHSALLQTIVHKANELLASGEDVVVHTSRVLEAGTDPEGSLQINMLVSVFLVSLLKHLEVRPSFIIAKGGITASDLATKGLGAKKALIKGQIIAGVPVWEMDEKCKYPGIMFVVFPGNVGDDGALYEVWRIMKG